MRGATLDGTNPDIDYPISIHAPHAGSDIHEPFVHLSQKVFQSTLPMRGATVFYRCFDHIDLISIHAPHAGSDSLLH